MHTGFDVEFPQIYIDAKQLEQVLINLYLNAIAAMPSGGNLWVNTKIDSAIDGAATGVIEVKDTGSGIEPHDLPKIFEPFFTAKKRTGLGLGLSVCKRIVKNHGGRKPQVNRGKELKSRFICPFARRAKGRNDGSWMTQPRRLQRCQSIALEANLKHVRCREFIL